MCNTILQFHKTLHMIRTLFFTLAFIFLFTKSYSQGKINKAEESLKNQEKNISSDSKSTYSNSSNDSEDHFLTEVISLYTNCTF